MLVDHTAGKTQIDLLLGPRAAASTIPRPRPWSSALDQIDRMPTPDPGPWLDALYAVRAVLPREEAAPRGGWRRCATP
ncbi:MAG: hypothetical protein R3B09_17440 [Nannocystaceae bacterium]